MISIFFQMEKNNNMKTFSEMEKILQILRNEHVSWFSIGEEKLEK